MLKIRLQRVGRKAEPSFRLVLTDSKNSTKSGKYLENLGNYDARRAEKSEFKSDRIVYWMSKGAKATTTVHNLLITKGVISGKKINALPLKKAIKKEVEAEAEVSPTASEKPAPAIAEEVKEEAPAPTQTEEAKEEASAEVAS